MTGEPGLPGERDGARQALAGRLGTGMNALRIRADRIHGRLEACVSARYAWPKSIRPPADERSRTIDDAGA